MQCKGDDLMDNMKYLRINYHIEIINDDKTWDKFVRATESLNAPYSDAPWELYTTKNFDSFEKAMEYYMVWYVSDDCYDIKMWQQLFLDDEMVYEGYCEPASTTRSEMRRMIDKGAHERLCNYDREARELEKQNKLMNAFISNLPQQYRDMFDEFCRREK